MSDDPRSKERPKKGAPKRITQLFDDLDEGLVEASVPAAAQAPPGPKMPAPAPAPAPEPVVGAELLQVARPEITVSPEAVPEEELPIEEAGPFEIPAAAPESAVQASEIEQDQLLQDQSTQLEPFPGGASPVEPVFTPAPVQAAESEAQAPDLMTVISELPSLAPQRSISLFPKDRVTGVQSIAQPRHGGDGALEEQGEQILPASQALTPIVEESLRQGKMVAKGAGADQPAMLAYARPLGEARQSEMSPGSETQTAGGEASVMPSLLFEVLDDNPSRKWSDDELLLVEQVTDQLSMALENARLFDESRSRAEQLAILNEMSRNLSAQLDIEEVLETVYRYTARLIDATNFNIALYLDESAEITFPIVVEENERVQWRTRSIGNGLPEYIFRTRQPMLIKDNLQETVQDVLGIEITERVAECWMGVPMIYSNQVIGVIAVKSYSQAHLYNESQLDLLMAIASQSAVAIENARLYSEERRRRQIADALSEIARAVSTTLDVRKICDQTLEQLAKLVDYYRAGLQLVHEGRRETIGWRILTDEYLPGSEAAAYPGGDEDLAQAIIKDQQPILVPDTLADPRWQALPGNEHIRAWLGVPLSVGDQIVGLLILEHNRPDAFTRASLEMAGTVAAQAAVGIQNARLFKQTRKALDALAVSERYQKSVAQAVASLTERGMAALSDVLKILGQSAKASRACYFETQVDQRGTYWRLIAEWCNEGVPSQLGNLAMRRLSVTGLADSIERLGARGFASMLASSSPPQEREFLDFLGSLSLLQFAVPGRHDAPGCMSFEQTDYERDWTADEISALQTAASALANTIVREELFTQVQVNLAETETMYQASARLNSAANYQEILNVLCLHTILGHSNAAHVSLNLFDSPWTQFRKPDWLIPVAEWSARSIEEETQERYPLSAWTNAELLLHPERPTVVMDIASDPRFDEARRKAYTERLGAKSLIYAPLNVSGRWIGHIIATYKQTTGFPEQEVRRLASLAGQAAVAIESLRLLDETRQRNEELASINQITSAVSRTLELNKVLGEILNRVLATIDYDSGLISIADPVSHRLYLSVYENLPEMMVQHLLEQGLEGTPCDMVFQLGESVYAPQIDDLPQEWQSWQEVFERPKSLGFKSYLGVPLESKGVKLGTVCLFNQVEKGINPSRLSLMQAIGQQLGVVVENARLFQETQVALTETETLYQASAELNAGRSYDDILQTLRKYTILGQADNLLSLSLFNQAWSDKDTPEWIIPVSNWTQLPAEKLRRRFALNNYPAARLLSPTKPAIVEDLHSDPELEKEVQQLFNGTLQTSSMIIAPLNVGGLWIGFLNGYYSQPIRFGEAEIRRLMALAGQAAVAVQNLNSVDLAEQRAREAQRRSEELSLINNIVTSVAASLDLQSSLNIIAADMAIALNAYTGIALLDPERPVLTVVANFSPYPDAPSTLGLEIPLEGNLSTQRVIDTRRSQLVDDPQHNSLTEPLHEVLRQLDVRSLLIIPILTGSDVVGTIGLEILKEERTFTPDEVRLAESIVLQAGTAIHNARLFEQNLVLLKESRQKAAQLQTAAEIARDTSTTLALDTLLQRTVNLLCERFGHYQASIFLVDESGVEAVVRESTGEAGEEMKRTGHSLPVGGQSLIGQVTATGQPLVINDVDAEEARAIHKPNPLLPNTHAELGIPLKIGERVIGALDVQSDKVNAFSEDDVSVMQVLSDQIAVAVDNARSYGLAQKAVEEIREADRLKSQFLANMSHELRTPLNSIIGFSRVILKGIDGPVNDLQGQDLTAIYNSGQHLLGLINDVLDLSKIEAGKMDLAFEDNINLAEIIKGVMSTTIGLVKDKTIELKQVIDPDLPLLRIDPMKVRQVLLNLLSNAAKFTDQGVITTEASLQTSPDGQQEVLVSVTDSGPGIAPEDQVKLFQPFSQVDGSLTRKAGGSGLGLSICHHLVHMHGGRIGLKSQVGKGSTFYFTLPIHGPKPASSPEGISQPEISTLEEGAGLEQPISEQVVPDEKPEAPQRSVEQPVTVLLSKTKPPTPPEGASQQGESREAPSGRTAEPPSGAMDLDVKTGLILAIDKDPKIIDLYRRYLVNEGCTIIALTDLDQVMNVARGLLPSAIMLDVAMQPAPDLATDLDGWEVLQALKSDSIAQHIPVIVCTILDEQEKAMSLGADDYLMKPILQDDLILSMRRFLG